MAQSRLALVTGAAGGIGRTIAVHLQERGWEVVGADLPESIAKLEDPRLLLRALDVCDRDAVDALVESLRAAPDLLVTAAGVQIHGALESLPFATWRRVLEVNLDGTFNCLQAVGRRMLDRGSGSIVTIASVAAERGVPGRAPYAASKAAVCSLTRSAAVEWSARGVRVNALAPGYVETGVYRAGVEQGLIDPAQILARVPAGRLASPSEVAEMVEFLGSGSAQYLTGQTIFLDGGFLIDYGVGSSMVAPASSVQDG